MSNYIYDEVEKLVRRFHTRDPFELLSCLHAVVRESGNFTHLKGFCFISCRTVYVVINENLSDAEKRIVAAHELGHIRLHRRLLQVAPMKDSILYDMTSRNEYEANLFAADLLLSDKELKQAAADDDPDYFSLCSALEVSPDLMSFKLFSLLKRGVQVSLPMNIDSRFLKKDLNSADYTR